MHVLRSTDSATGVGQYSVYQGALLRVLRLGILRTVAQGEDRPLTAVSLVPKNCYVDRVEVGPGEGSDAELSLM